MKNLFWTTGVAAALLFSGCDFEERIPAEMVSLDQSRPIVGEKSLRAEIRFDIGSLEVSCAEDPFLYSYALEYDKATYKPDVQYDMESGGEGRLKFTLESTRKFGIRTERRSNRLHLNLTDSVPVSLRVNTGVGESRLSLSRLRLEGLELDSGVGGTKISAYEPNPVVCDRIRLENGVGSMEAVGLGNLNFRRLDFEGGVGGANLDFSGEWKQDAEIRIEVGVGGVTVRVPRDIGVRVEAEKHFLSGLHLEGFQKRDSDYYSENYDNARVRIYMRVQTGVGGFKVSWI